MFGFFKSDKPANGRDGGGSQKDPQPRSPPADKLSQEGREDTASDADSGMDTVEAQALEIVKQLSASKETRMRDKDLHSYALSAEVDDSARFSGGEEPLLKEMARRRQLMESMLPKSLAQKLATDDFGLPAEMADSSMFSLEDKNADAFHSHDPYQETFKDPLDEMRTPMTAGSHGQNTSPIPSKMSASPLQQNNQYSERGPTMFGSSAGNPNDTLLGMNEGAMWAAYEDNMQDNDARVPEHISPNRGRQQEHSLDAFREVKGQSYQERQAASCPSSPTHVSPVFLQRSASASPSAASDVTLQDFGTATEAEHDNASLSNENKIQWRFFPPDQDVLAWNQIGEQQQMREPQSQSQLSANGDIYLQEEFNGQAESETVDSQVIASRRLGAGSATRGSQMQCQQNNLSPPGHGPPLRSPAYHQLLTSNPAFRHAVREANNIPSSTAASTLKTSLTTPGGRRRANSAERHVHFLNRRQNQIRTGLEDQDEVPIENYGQNEENQAVPELQCASQETLDDTTEDVTSSGGPYPLLGMYDSLEFRAILASLEMRSKLEKAARENHRLKKSAARSEKKLKQKEEQILMLKKAETLRDSIPARSEKACLQPSPKGCFEKSQTTACQEPTVEQLIQHPNDQNLHLRLQKDLSEGQHSYRGRQSNPAIRTRMQQPLMERHPHHHPGLTHFAEDNASQGSHCHDRVQMTCQERRSHLEEDHMQNTTHSRGKERTSKDDCSFNEARQHFQMRNEAAFLCHQQANQENPMNAPQLPPHEYLVYRCQPRSSEERSVPGCEPRAFFGHGSDDHDASDQHQRTFQAEKSNRLSDPRSWRATWDVLEEREVENHQEEAFCNSRKSPARHLLEPVGDPREEGPARDPRHAPHTALSDGRLVDRKSEQHQAARQQEEQPNAAACWARPNASSIFEHHTLGDHQPKYDQPAQPSPFCGEKKPLESGIFTDEARSSDCQPGFNNSVRYPSWHMVQPDPSPPRNLFWKQEDLCCNNTDRCLDVCKDPLKQAQEEVTRVKDPSKLDEDRRGSPPQKLEGFENCQQEQESSARAVSRRHSLANHGNPHCDVKGNEESKDPLQEWSVAETSLEIPEETAGKTLVRVDERSRAQSPIRIELEKVVPVEDREDPRNAKFSEPSKNAEEICSNVQDVSYTQEADQELKESPLTTQRNLKVMADPQELNNSCGKRCRRETGASTRTNDDACTVKIQSQHHGTPPQEPAARKTACPQADKQSDESKNKAPSARIDEEQLKTFVKIIDVSHKALCPNHKQKSAALDASAGNPKTGCVNRMDTEKRKAGNDPPRVDHMDPKNVSAVIIVAKRINRIPRVKGSRPKAIGESANAAGMQADLAVLGGGSPQPTSNGNQEESGNPKSPGKGSCAQRILKISGLKNTRVVILGPKGKVDSLKSADLSLSIKNPLSCQPVKAT